MTLFLIGLIVGGACGYTVKVVMTNKSQKTTGPRSPNVMGDSNSVKM